MASLRHKAGGALGKVPLVKDYREERARRAAQDTLFTSSAADGYLEPEPTVGEWFRQGIPTGIQALQYISDTFPCSKWLFNYNLTWFLGDLIAGITVGAVVVPQSMAYSKLAQLPVEYGLYTSFFGALCYWVFGTSKDINIGPVAVASIVTGTIIVDIQHDQPEQSAVVLASALAMLCGGIICLMGLLRLGWIVDLISLPAVSAFITGSALTITFGQIPVLLGIRGISSRDPAYKIGINVFKHLDRISIDAAVGVSSLIMLYGIKWACGVGAKRRPTKATIFFFISTLRTVFVILVYTLVSYLVNRTHKKNPTFRMLGFIPRGFHEASPPKIDAVVLKALAGQLPAATIVLLIEHISIAKSFGRANNYTINPSSEFIAIGVTNMIGPIIGAYAATGSFSRTAINAKAGSRTPLAGVVTAAVVLLALYTLTPMFYFVPRAALASVIIHAIGDMITSPRTLYEFWRISPFDVLVFFTGLFVTIFSSIEHGIFATVGLSILLLLFRMFKAHGKFLGKVKVRSIHGDVGASSSSSINLLLEKDVGKTRNVFLPFDRHDGSNPRIELETPYPGMFIYRFTEGFNYTNANHYLDHMVKVVMEETRPTLGQTFEKPGDRPWNDFKPRASKKNTEAPPDTRPTLKAIILDCSTIHNVDLTSVQSLIDTRNQLDRYAAPHSVQWHFSSVNSRWTKRALAAAGFGYPSFETASGTPQHWKPIFSVAEVSGAGDNMPLDGDTERPAEPTMSGADQDVEMGQFQTTEDKITVVQMEVAEDGKPSKEEIGKVAAIHGVNRPYFHVDVQSALRSAIVFDTLRESSTLDGQDGADAKDSEGDVTQTEDTSAGKKH